MDDKIICLVSVKPIQSAAVGKTENFITNNVNGTLLNDDAARAERLLGEAQANLMMAADRLHPRIEKRFLYACTLRCWFRVDQLLVWYFGFFGHGDI